jgi:hypothetical protein
MSAVAYQRGSGIIVEMLGARSRWISVTSAIALSTAVGCGARAGNPDDTGDDGSGTDAPVGVSDARSAVDASTVDARPCVEGDMQAVDPATGTCFTAHIGTRVPWATARAACQAIGADLATVTSAAENAFLTTLLGANEAFLGGNDLALEGTFRWVDDTLLTYTNWRINEPESPNEPNNGNGNYQEDCIVLQGQLGGVWDDRPCASDELPPPAGTHFYLCAR